MSVNLDQELMRAHLDLFRAMKHEMKPSSSITNLTLVQLNALIFLGDRRDAHVSDVANYFGIAIPTATVLLDRLTSLGLVQRVPDKTDRRVIGVVLTKKGEKLLSKAMKERENMFKKVFAKLSTKDKNDFLRIMRHIAQN
ncbi:hypothetical protein A3G67_02030 [Candidatus Roizmanbacteria bacterium RIFCSPLOWO2_12_FULL_40_12]|uniref:HTH marR-type domain-containing protein n=1 Tax=Candidatus Roizmanbacteria bacterium RIFCSPLOWO2_01_FULL_40_42 TaxID=1802066 RepID=A0A1F7J3L2_9BACT|nr:MAG: hypothetical protein A2779_01150 [Candidatus Roizmanbacteria bacterium RIFCSPHIGHO2_01_FULL_40_98]OGK28974.1 MAG: hypothetical protein A3C31_01790 [Candidatus Roizmanbacteria bacterium RIFCSPHIGHO2_02_FULL_40_53]OGK29560.1 MAG: hypothetical protein A2W49_03750 [Candidatus Roizmanbacteria bacterium RIFCSPHIGHO2_12_41_18]OGK37261.1 MAG: hypothetical protein A3E69_04090 [Candidatus Roizmanbacteria bacterium RIFCSPHIGHO2_12_FULL_40_130]OGK50203.1 MAG: hypothetical protein A3B50_00245 [Candi